MILFNRTNKKIKRLKIYFQRRPDILMAFLFGSQAKGKPSNHSDWDIGIYFKPDSKYPSWEEKVFYPQENWIWQDVEKILKREVDLVVLNRAPSSILFTVLRSGLPLIIKNRRIYLDLLSQTSFEAIDFSNFVYDFWQIKQKAQSLNQEDKIRLLEITDFLATELEDWNQFQNLTWEVYQSQRSKRREVERWIENIVNASLDIAKIILAAQKKDIPATYQETLKTLGTTNFFKPAFAERISQWTRLRNILAHRYLDLRWEQISKFIQEAQQDFIAFIGIVKSLFKK